MSLDADGGHVRAMHRTGGSSTCWDVELLDTAVCRSDHLLYDSMMMILVILINQRRLSLDIGENGVGATT